MTKQEILTRLLRSVQPDRKECNCFYSIHRGGWFIGCRGSNKIEFLGGRFSTAFLGILVDMEYKKLHEWRSIDTIPRDGTRVLATDGENTHIISENQFVILPQPENGYVINDSEETCLNSVFYPTKWMPLPT